MLVNGTGRGAVPFDLISVQCQDDLDSQHLAAYTTEFVVLGGLSVASVFIEKQDHLLIWESRRHVGLRKRRVRTMGKSMLVFYFRSP